ncbi:PTS mannose transporter subunit IID [Psittacicella melopsittaci]|uniref:PTS mannose transporter subunit IID n=1 Tax=Psittacicella melopsittaci TaxID=2028576 RepID=A0A3A1Y5G8_9GAMM|nr:PTS mannose transporter subunit IID [Psittacicella melopsittaci]RIY32845.1 PTS mannose transporter subunit IID [Psittacicella melopsittaci]
MTQQNSERKITDADLRNMFIRSNAFQGSWNFERMQALGWAYTFLPILKRLYPENNEARKKAIKSHLEFFNTQPFVAAPILGIAASLEEQKANGADIEDGAINSVKVGMMGPLAGVGDPIFWGAARPILAALGASLAIQGSILGPIVFFLGFNIIRLLVRYYGIFIGYKQGVSLVQDASSGVLQKLTEGASILGLFIIGVLVNKWASVNVVLPLPSTSPDAPPQTLQTIFDSLIPGLLPLGLTFLCMWLLRKGVSPITQIFGGFALGIVGYWLGILG